jgi:hypothetical protein
MFSCFSCFYHRCLLLSNIRLLVLRSLEVHEDQAIEVTFSILHVSMFHFCRHRKVRTTISILKLNNVNEQSERTTMKLYLDYRALPLRHKLIICSNIPLILMHIHTCMCVCIYLYIHVYASTVSYLILLSVMTQMPAKRT